MHFPGSGESSRGMTRMVTLRSFLIRSSISRDPFQCASAKPLWSFGFSVFFDVEKPYKFSFESLTRVFWSRDFLVRAYRVYLTDLRISFGRTFNSSFVLDSFVLAA